MLQLCELFYFLYKFLKLFILVCKTTNNLHNFAKMIEEYWNEELQD